MRQKLKTFFFSALMVFILQHEVKAQSVRQVADKIRTSVTNLDLDGMISLYADTVHYVDPIYGSDNLFPKATVRQFFAPMFKEGSTFDLKLLTVAVDDKEQSIILKGTTYNQAEKGPLPFIVYLKIEQGKIVKQMDFPVYDVEALRNAPRYKGYFKEKSGG